MSNPYEKLNGKRYSGNKDTKEVHDLENEKSACRFMEVLLAHNEVFFDTLAEAHQAGYHNCKHCIRISTT